MSRLPDALAFSSSPTEERKISIYRSRIRKSAASSLQHSFEFIRDRAKSIHGPFERENRLGRHNRSCIGGVKHGGQKLCNAYCRILFYINVGIQV